MRAVVLSRFGARPEVKEVPVPTLGPGQVRVRQVCSSVAAGDWLMAEGRPLVFRPVFALLLRPPILGRDVAGVVVEVAAEVAGIEPGDRVVGEVAQAWAEEVVVNATSLAVLPDEVSFEEASTLSVSGITALQGLRAGELKAGDAVVVVGASGGVGHLAVQLAVAQGAVVTGVCSGSKADAVRDAGAQQVVDYASAPLASLGPRFDVVLDLSGRSSLSTCLGLLRPGGRYVSSAGANGGVLLGPIPRLLRCALRGLWDGRVRSVVSSPSRDDYETLLSRVLDGTLRPWLGVELPLERADEALTLIGTGQARGKSILRM